MKNIWWILSTTSLFNAYFFKNVTKYWSFTVFSLKILKNPYPWLVRIHFQNQMLILYFFSFPSIVNLPPHTSSADLHAPWAENWVLISFRFPVLTIRSRCLLMVVELNGVEFIWAVMLGKVNRQDSPPSYVPLPVTFSKRFPMPDLIIVQHRNHKMWPQIGRNNSNWCVSVCKVPEVLQKRGGLFGLEFLEPRGQYVIQPGRISQMWQGATLPMFLLINFLF